MTTEDIRAELQQNIDEKYRAFHASLVPGIGTFLGVRVPKMREIAKKAAKEDYQTFFAEADVSVYEELMIQGMIPGYAKLTIKQRKQELERFVPYINNWAVCDCCCATYKFMKKDQDEWLAFLKKYLSSEKEYELRFAIVCLLDFFINDTYIDEVLELLADIQHDAYYVKMADAWALSICYIKFPQKTEPILERETLDGEIRKKAVQKIRESLRVSKEEKERLKKKFY